ncbi:MAG: hypothetical protein PHC60_10415 [Heliobacteriaceae bacterium]|nr:hypothetical protein [Heliobacteriaceae bacterium]MDD4588772.1 hypothetical protein [Heliobacteriaceae bacterium]
MMSGEYRGFFDNLGTVAGLIITLIIIGAFFPNLFGFGHHE